jgi:amino acid permease
MTSTNVGGLLTGSRMLFALAEKGELPRFFGTIHPRYRTPSNAIIFTTLVAWASGLRDLSRRSRSRVQSRDWSPTLASAQQRSSYGIGASGT